MLQLKERKIFTLKTSLIIGFVVHLFLIVNSMQNIDSMWGTYYSKYDSSSMGRFTLSLLSGLSSWFDLQYLNSLFSILFLAITSMLLVELFDFKDKKIILIFVVLYTAFPSVSGTLTYSFLTDTYFLATLLIVFSVFILKIGKEINSFYLIIFSSILIYISIGVYQTNLAYIITLYLIILLKECVNNTIEVKFYIKGALSILLGLLGYVIHYKIYQNQNGNNLTNYQGINEAGNINLASIQISFEKSLTTFVSYFFGDFKFINLFERLNVIYILIIILILIVSVYLKKISIKNTLIIFLITLILPFTIFLMYFVSPGIFYHNLMIHHMVFIFVIGMVLIEKIEFKKIGKINITYFVFLGILGTIGLNFIIITNIYYEKLETINNQIYSLGTQVAYEIRHLDGYEETLPLVIIGDPAITLPPNILYDEKTPPLSPGTGPHQINSSHKFSRYLEQFIGLRNIPVNDENLLIEEEQPTIEEMQLWPQKNSVKIINGHIVIKFSN